MIRKRYKEIVMTVTLLTPIILIITGILMLMNIRSGYNDGWFKTSVKLGIVLASAFIAAVLSVLSVLIFQDAIVEMVYDIGWIDFIIENSFKDVILTLASMLVSALLFIPMFLIVLFVFRLIVAAAYRTRGGAYRDGYLSEDATFLERQDKKLGACTGAVVGFITAVILLSPFTGMLDSISHVVDIADSIANTEEGGYEVIGDMEDYSEDASVIFFNACGGKTFFNISTTTICNGNITNLNSELTVVGKMDINNIELEFDREGGFSKKSKKRIDELIGYAEESPIARMMLTIVANEMSSAWLEGQPYMDIERPALASDNAMNRFSDEMLEVLADTTEKTVCLDLTTMVSVYDIIASYSYVLDSGDYGYIIDELAGGDLIVKIEKELKKNSNMSSVLATMDDIMIEKIAEEITSAKYTDEIRKVLYADIAESLSDHYLLPKTTRAELVSDDINTAFNKCGIYTSADMASKLATKLIEDIAAPGGDYNADLIKIYFETLRVSK